MTLATLCAAFVLAASELVTGEPKLEAEGFIFSEGPLWLPSAQSWVFTDVPVNKIFRLDKTVFAENTGGANGLILDDEEAIIACQGTAKSIARIDSDGTITVLVDKYDGKKFNAPNDLVRRSDGTIFFTDPQPPRKEGLELDFTGVYALDNDGKLTLVVKDLRYPNGIALSPDEKTLYVAETTGSGIQAFDLDGVTVKNQRQHCKVTIPDGMAMDSAGTIWCATSGGIAIINPDGTVIDTIKIPLTPTNCKFGGADGKTLLVTARSKVYSLQTTRTGMYFASKAAAPNAPELTAGPVEMVAEGFLFTEGPVWLPSNELIFSDIPADTIYKLNKSVYLKPSGKSNGLTLDREGRLIRCEHGNRRVTRTEKDGHVVVVLADSYEGKKLNSPNDAVVRSDGTIFFTDPPYGLEGREQELDFQGVYAIAPDGKLTLLVQDFIKPNGIALSPDEKTLYVADTDGGHIRAFSVAADGSVSNGHKLFDIGFPDGIRVDVQGNIWATGVLESKGVVGVFGAQGERLAAIAFPQNPANCGFGGEDGKTLYATARTAVYSVRTTIPGIVPGR